MSFADHFSSVAATYAAYRPHYPDALVELLAAESPARGLAWDAGCGNGQLSVALAARFERVIATDPSRAQLDAAEVRENIDYRCEPAEQSSLAAGCADLAVAAQAAHWFDWPRYTAEVARVAKPGALAAVVGYGGLAVTGDAGDLIDHYYKITTAGFWPKGREHVDNHYRDLVWPWPEVPAHGMQIVAQWTRAELLGYLATWSATQRLTAAKGDAPYRELCDAVAARWPDDERREITWPLAIRLARVSSR
jgi:SAM-dependent methyltransferase